MLFKDWWHINVLSNIKVKKSKELFVGIVILGAHRVLTQQSGDLQWFWINTFRTPLSHTLSKFRCLYIQLILDIHMYLPENWKVLEPFSKIWRDWLNNPSNPCWRSPNFEHIFKITVEIIDDRDEHWWKGSNDHGVGWIPVNFVSTDLESNTGFFQKQLF